MEIKSKLNVWKTLLQHEVRIACFTDSMKSAIEITRPLVQGQRFLPQLIEEAGIDKNCLVENRKIHTKSLNSKSSLYADAGGNGCCKLRAAVPDENPELLSRGLRGARVHCPGNERCVVDS